jgi:hypothetical protein
VVVHQLIVVPDVNRLSETVPVTVAKRSARRDRAVLRAAITPASEAHSATAVRRWDTAVGIRVIAEMDVRVGSEVVIQYRLLRV